jgi:hypothetical protein
MKTFGFDPVALRASVQAIGDLNNRLNEIEVHLIKLEAWLKMSSLPTDIQDLMRNWNADTISADLPNGFAQAVNLETYKQWSSHALALSHTLAQDIDFAQALHDFCASKIAT